MVRSADRARLRRVVSGGRLSPPFPCGRWSCPVLARLRFLSGSALFRPAPLSAGRVALEVGLFLLLFVLPFVLSRC